jgi:hypothetical protein
MNKIDFSELKKELVSDLEERGLSIDFISADKIVGLMYYDDFSPDYGYCELHFSSGRIFRRLYDRITGLKVCRFYEIFFQNK